MSLEKLCKLVADGENEEAKELAANLLEGGFDPHKMIDAMTTTMNYVGDQFAKLEVFLPEIMMATLCGSIAIPPTNPASRNKATR